MQEENALNSPVADAPVAEVAPVVEASAPVTAAEPALPTIGGGKNVILPQHAIGKLKEEQRQRGAREAVSELEAKFKAAGFSSIDDAIAAMAAVKNNAAKPAPAKAPAAPMAAEAEISTDDEVQTAAQPQGTSDYAKQMQKLQREREKLAKQFAAEQSQRRKLQRQLEAKEAEFALRETAVSNGVKDVDYALRLIQRELEGKDETALASFDESKFFGTLRQTHPYLFGELVVPATTGTGVGAAPSAPKAGNVQAAQGEAGKLNARDMKPDDFQKLMRARGFSPLI